MAEKKRIDIDLVIFTATSNEAVEARRVQREPFGKTTVGTVNASIGHLGKHTCLTVASGMSKRRLNNTFQDLARKFKPRLFINFGAAGAINPKLDIAKPTIPAEIVGYTWPDLDTRGQLISCPWKPLEKIDPSLTITKAGSCAHDIRDKEIRERLFQLYKIDTTDWETHRLAEACRLLKIPFLALRCISDHADARAGIEYSKNAQTALQRGARLLERIADKALDIIENESK